MRVLLVCMLLLFLPLHLAGCLDSPARAADGAGLGALEARRVADSEARGWNPEAYLVGLMGIEEGGEPDGAARRDVHADGRAQRYFFWYRAPGEETAWNVTVGGDGRVLHAGPERTGDKVPVQDWRIDSPEAVAVLRQEADGFAGRADGDRVRWLAYMLIDPSNADELPVNGTAWLVLEVSTSVFLHAVDAANGTLLFSQDLEELVGSLLAEWGTFSDTLTAVDASRTHRFSLASPHDTVRFRLAADAAAPGGTLTLNVTGPGVWGEESLAPLAPGDEAFLDVEPAARGDWTVRVELDGVATDYTLDYCTDGMPMPVGTFGSPCGRVWD